MVQNTALSMAERWHKNAEVAARLPEELKAQRQAKKKAAVCSKLDLGGKLTEGEKHYLRREEPELHALAARMEWEQWGYEKALQRCHGQQGRKELQFHKTMSVLSGANVRGKMAGMADSNSTLARLYHLREAERKVRYSAWG